jgi:hypothetical protein
MNTTPFSTILEDSRQGLPSFLERWRRAALLVESAGERRPTELTGRSPYPTRTSRTPTRTSASSVATAELPRAPYLEHANLVWLEKSSRNSFTEIISLGRAGENDLRFDVDSLSALHATLVRSGERWFVQDHESRNGTYVNGERLMKGVLRRLGDGDALRFGDVLRARFFAPRALYDFLRIVHGAASGPDRPPRLPPSPGEASS